MPARLMLFAAVLNAVPAAAEVVSQSENRFRVTHTLTIDAPPEAVFRVMHEDVGQWWSSDHTFSGDAANLSIELKPHGWFREELPGGGFTRHLEIVYVQPNHTIRFLGGLGPLQGMPVQGVMTWSARAKGDGTELVFDYRVSGESEPPLSEIAAAVDRVIGDQAAGLKTHCERTKAKGAAE